MNETVARRLDIPSAMTPNPVSTKKRMKRSVEFAPLPHSVQCMLIVNIVRNLTKSTSGQVRDDLGDKSTNNVSAVTLAVATNISKVLSEYYVNEGILGNALRLLQRIYSDNANFMRELQRIENGIAERGNM